MSHSHSDGAHTHGSDSSNVLDALAQLVAVIALAVAGIDILMWVLHILIIVATAIGFTVLAVAGGYGWYRWRQFQNRRYQRLMQGPPPYPLYLSGRVEPSEMIPTPALPPVGGESAPPPATRHQLRRGGTDHPQSRTVRSSGLPPALAHKHCETRPQLTERTPASWTR